MGETAQDSQTTHKDHSRERRETQGTSTNIIQLYNILTGYHAGTNRASFLLLPRPHTMQATDHRTFIQGLRDIEGIQEFFIVVSRPAGQDGLSIDVSLETAHLSEEAALEPPRPENPLGTVTTDFLVTHRNLCARYRMVNACPAPEPTESQIVDPDAGEVVIVHEDRLTLRAPMASAFGQRASVLPALKEVLRRVQFTMMTTAHSRYRRAVGGVGYLDTDYVGRRLCKTIPRTRARQPPEADYAPARLETRPGEAATVGELAELGFVDLATRTGLSGADLVRFRRSLLGRTPPPDATGS
jgi:hypothetical protein